MEHEEKKLPTHADGENVSKADMAPIPIQKYFVQNAKYPQNKTKYCRTKTGGYERRH